MRHPERQVTDREGLLGILRDCDTVRLAANGVDVPFIIPLSYGLLEGDEDGNPTLYFHSALEGEKFRYLTDGAEVSFEMDCDHELAPRIEVGFCTMNYRSIIGRGRIAYVTDPDEQHLALRLLLDHYHGPEFPLNDKALPRTTVYKLVISEMTGKAKHTRSAG